MFEALTSSGFQVVTQHHAEAILNQDMPAAVSELTGALRNVSIPVEEIVRSGGGETDFTQRLRNALAALQWKKHNFEITKTVDGQPKQSLSHEIDHVRVLATGTIALEIEWNNKDPFFDRDLENFKRLHVEGAISVGAIITRGTSMQDSFREIIVKFAQQNQINGVADLARYYRPTLRQEKIYQRKAESVGDFATGWADAFVSDKFGEATTHWRKLDERLHRGVGTPCPLLLIGIPASILKL